MKNLYPLLLMIFLVVGSQAQNYTYPWRDPEVDTELRIDDLIGRLSLDEKASLMLYNSPAIEGLGIEEYNWWNECLHGVGRAGKATVFPQSIGLAATFDEHLLYRVADAISSEARAKHHAAVRKGNRAQYMGLTFWSPNVNIFRDPRWGRGQETYGEDPFLSALLGKAFVRGLQGKDPYYLKTAACAKHYVVHSGPEASRHHFNALPGETDFRETYLPAFRELVEADVEAVMCAYNRTFDEPCCGSSFLLQDILRQEMGFDGHIVSDCWALDDIWARHQVVGTRQQAAAMAARAGVNLNCGYIYKYLPEAVRTRMISEEDVDAILRPVLRTRFRLGLFDPDSLNPYAAIPESIVDCDEHRALAREAAVKSMVLLKNDGALPLDREKLNSIFVTGPMATDLFALVGNYNGYSGEMVTMLEGIVDAAGPAIPVDYSAGVLLNNDSIFNGFWQAGFADLVIAVMGINRLLEGEDGDAMLNTNGGDRAGMEFPENQLRFLRMLRKNTNGKKLIVVVTGGSALALGEVSELADALIFAWYPGEEGGNALADILFGNKNPSGRLPLSFYHNTDDLPPFDDYSMQGRTYRFFQGEVLYPFGYGLSYSTFHYRSANLTYHFAGELAELSVRVNIHNPSLYDGEEVVQVYVKRPFTSAEDPLKTLLGVQRVFVPAGQSVFASIPLDIDFMKAWDKEKQQYVLRTGKYLFEIGSSSGQIHKELSLDIE